MEVRMITLFVFGPYFGLPEASPYVLKTELQLRMAGLAYTKDFTGFPTAPKGKLPYIADDGEVIADSTFIRAHIERKYGFDFDAGLSASERAEAWAVERMLEDHLNWAMTYFRWMVPENFERGPAQFFQAVPEPARAGVIAETKATVKANHHAMGIGRHTPDEIATLGLRSLVSFSAMLGGRPYLMGAEPCGTDATASAMFMSMLAPVTQSPLRDRALELVNLAPYAMRVMQRFYPEHRWETPLAA
jgi:glutathione S-transferase